MPDWNSLLNELNTLSSAGPFDILRRKYLKQLSDITGRNVIIYYSGWLQKPGIPDEAINDNDKNGFMTTIHSLDRSKGLDLILHTPGGDLAATESIVDYLRQMFGNNVRAIIPQLSMSAGTMIACSCKSIVMGKQSNLGPIDPQFGNLPAHGVIEEFQKAVDECKKDPSRVPLWQPIIAKYNPTLLGECQKSIAWSQDIVTDWLRTGMLKDDPKKDEKILSIIRELGDHALTKSHSRHISSAKCKEIGLNIEDMETDQVLQDAILSVHHACIHTLTSTPAFKIIENQNGQAFIRIAQLAVPQNK
ncbi:MAG: serine protease [Methanomicrobiales archaeon HGW-Methanomicrobiales-1]|jgi:ATP-dependent protease ClpP protease subunit|nr:MAG: serine protease [Methanomicrobiales archaeon HGW-Methanomicrobiales-1]